MRNKIFISIYRFDEEYLTFINENFKESENTFVSLFELKNRGIKNLIKEFISYKKYGEVVIVFNDENYFLVQDLFYTLSLSIFSLNITRILPDKKQEKVSLLKRISSVFKMMGSAIETKKLVKKIASDIKLKSKKSKIELKNDSKVFYLKTNVDFGTKAGGSLGHISGVVNSLAKKSDITYISAETPIMIDESIKKEKIYLNDVKQLRVASLERQVKAVLLQLETCSSQLTKFISFR